MATVEQKIAEWFDHLVPSGGFPINANYPERSRDPNFLDARERVKASIPLIDTDLSKACERANAIARAVCAVDSGERGEVLLGAVEVYRKADDPHRRQMIRAAIKDACEDHKSIGVYDLDGRCQAAAFLLRVATVSADEERDLIGLLASTKSLKTIFDEASQRYGTAIGEEQPRFESSTFNKSILLKNSYWDRLEDIAANARLENRQIQEGLLADARHQHVRSLSEQSGEHTRRRLDERHPTDEGRGLPVQQRNHEGQGSVAEQLRDAIITEAFPLTSMARHDRGKTAFKEWQRRRIGNSDELRASAAAVAPILSGASDGVKSIVVYSIITTNNQSAKVAALKELFLQKSNIPPRTINSIFDNVIQSFEKLSDLPRLAREKEMASSILDGTLRNYAQSNTGNVGEIDQGEYRYRRARDSWQGVCSQIENVATDGSNAAMILGHISATINTKRRVILDSLLEEVELRRAYDHFGGCQPEDHNDRQDDALNAALEPHRNAGGHLNVHVSIEDAQVALYAVHDYTAHGLRSQQEALAGLSDSASVHVPGSPRYQARSRMREGGRV